MISGRYKFIPLSFSLAVALAALASVADAAGVRYAGVTGTASGPGMITIETFSKPDFPGRTNPRATAACSPCAVMVPIPNGFTAIQTAAAIADSAASQLASENYTANVVGGFPNTAAICFNGPGPFISMNIIENIPGQTVVEVPASSVPTLTEWGLLLLLALLPGIGIYMLQRRTEPGRSST